MLHFMDKFLGALLRLLIFTPFFMLTIVFTPLLCLDRLVQGRPIDALLELIRFPFKILLLLAVLLETLYDGWSIGLATLMSTLIPRIRNFFYYEILTNPDFLFSLQMGGKYIINHYEGPLFGRLIRKVISLSLSYEQFKCYEAYHESPHNSDSTRSINVVYTDLSSRYGDRLLEQYENINQNIDKFLKMRIKNAITTEEIKFAKAAGNCYRQFKENYKDNFITNAALDIESAPKPLRTLYLVWMALEAEATEEQSTQLKELLASFMTQIQRGLYRSINPTDTKLYVEDQPECPTGAVAILLSVLTSLLNSKYRLTPSKVESVQRLRELIHFKLNDNYNIEKNSLGSILPIPLRIPEKNFKKQEKRLLSHYARFLVQTPQGKRLLGGIVSLNNEDIQATVDAAIYEWKSRP